MSDRPEDLQRNFENALRYEYDVFIIFASDDQELATHILEGLEAASLRCNAQFKPNSFQIGQNVFDNVVYNVKNANRTLLLLTEKSLQSRWVTLETILALEESQRCNSLRLRMIVNNITEKDVKVFKRGILASVPHTRVDFNKKDWNCQLAKEINEEISIPAILPVGSMAHGLVFSHYTGFLSYVLPVLKEEIRKSKIYQQTPLHVSLKYYMLLPGTCNIYDDLSSEDSEDHIKIEKEEILQFERHHAGKPRKFSLTIYKISKGDEVFYFFADFPHVLKAMFSMEDKRLAEVDIRFQIARFYFTMNEMINHAENQACHNTVQLLLFNENVESMQAVLWKAVSDSVPQEVQESLSADIENMEIDQPLEKLCKVESGDSQPVIDATVSCSDDCNEDRDIAQGIFLFLDGKGKKVEINTKDQSHFKLSEASWHIFVLSKEALESNSTLSTQCMGAMADGLSCQALRVLVVIRNLEPRHVPRFIKCVNMLKVTEPNFCDKILTTMNGGPLRLEHSLPAGDVATGLAWAYVINYLVITLLGTSSEDDLGGRIQRFLRDKNEHCGCIKKLFILLPKSCTTAPDLAVEANENPDIPGVKRGTGRVTYLGRTEPVVVNTGGQLERKFFLHIYRHEDPVSKRSVCFISEYCTPANCMREMTENYKFAGLNEEELEKQSKEFCDLFPDIIQREAVKHGLGDISELVEIIYYNDKTETLLAAIESHIQTAGQEIVYA